MEVIRKSIGQVQLQASKKRQMAGQEKIKMWIVVLGTTTTTKEKVISHQTFRTLMTWKKKKTLKRDQN